MRVAALDELRVDAEDDAAAERNRCWVEIDGDGDGGGEVLVVVCGNGFKKILHIGPALDAGTVEVPQGI